MTQEYHSTSNSTPRQSTDIGSGPKEAYKTRVYLEGRVPGWKLHSLYDSIVDHPPDGFDFVGDKAEQRSMNGSVMRSIDRYLSSIDEFRNILGIVKPSIYYAYYRMHRPAYQGAELIYSSQHLIFTNSPWVVDLESVAALVGYGRLNGYRRILERTLASKFCKRIMPWSDAGKQTLMRNLDCRGFEHKIETVHLAVPPKSFVRNHREGRTRVLFVGTGNSFNLRGSFEMKGGRELIVAFKRLRQKYRDLDLTIRSSVPNEYVETCRRADIRILSELLPFDRLAQEFENADIFVYPGHTTPGAVILDAMSYELPVIATDVWANREMVFDGYTGLLTTPSRYARYDGGSSMSGWGEPSLRSISQIDPAMVDDLVEKLAYLIEHPEVRCEMGRNGRREIETGRFSLIERNRTLGQIFRESLGS